MCLYYGGGRINGSVVGRGFTVLFLSAGLVFDTFSPGGFLSEIR